jgi:hypothetical protein
LLLELQSSQAIGKNVGENAFERILQLTIAKPARRNPVQFLSIVTVTAFDVDPL